MAENYRKGEQRITLALAKPFKGRRRNLRVLAIKHGVSYDRLRRRSVGKPSKSTRLKTNQTLNPE
ncbi:uncharacterized protein K441DRAFT_661811 [Cenococcum geophilum 1.58]|uniref:uncharacterized protein n=1 Tax=Cenococcum geophilum 1.58 TaxID=794803 RepID=UPI00358E41EF|nr:hypothetical protein K441DRAFT_661811 [Cenococcum geophilum 1.58]